MASATSQKEEEWAETLRNSGIVLESVDWRDKDDVAGA